MVALGFDRGGRGKQLVLAVAGYGHHLGDNGATLSQRPRLIEEDGVHPGKTFERVAPFGGQPGEASVAALAKIVSDPRVADVCDAAVRAVDRRASGVFCFDVREDARGVPCVTEINAGRFSMSTNLYDLVGKHNMALTYVRLALGGPVDFRGEYDAPEGYYMVRELDTLAGIFHANEFFEGIEDVRP